MPPYRPLDERFVEKFEFVDSGCWQWTAALTKDGYGTIGIGNRRTALAHRVSYELLVGPIPEGLTLDHLCRNRACVNPEHLEPVTLAENCLRGVGAPALHARKTHCMHGHPFAGHNLSITPSGKGVKRVCKACLRASQARYRARKGAAA